MIGVVGGGIAGLAATHRLQQAGHEVQLFEAGSQLGGLAATYETAGDPIERFYHHLSANETTIVELAAELGLEEAVEWHIGENAYYVDGVEHPLDTIWQIAAYPYLSVYDKLRLGLLTKGIDVRGGIPRTDSYDDLTVYEGTPIEEFLREHTTAGVYEYFFEPLLDAKFGKRKNDISAAWLLGRIKFRSERDLLRGERLGYIDGGFGRLLDRLVAAVGAETITANARVTGLEYGDRVERLTVEGPAGPGVGLCGRHHE
jgi:protoporphyrinogen oxidase